LEGKEGQEKSLPTNEEKARQSIIMNTEKLLPARRQGRKAPRLTPPNTKTQGGKKKKKSGMSTLGHENKKNQTIRKEVEKNLFGIGLKRTTNRAGRNSRPRKED